MILRQLRSELLTQLGEFPVVTVLGPREAGKTSLARSTLPDFEYVSLEDPETLSIATYHSSFKKNLSWFRDNVAELERACIVYSGHAQAFSDGIQALPFRDAHEIFEER